MIDPRRMNAVAMQRLALAGMVDITGDTFMQIMRPTCGGMRDDIRSIGTDFLYAGNDVWRSWHRSHARQKVRP